MHQLKQAECIPILESMVYWYNREQFFYDQDVCAAWTIFAVESGRFLYRMGNQEGIAEVGDLVICAPGTLLYRQVKTVLSFYFFLVTWRAMPGSKLSTELPLTDEQLQGLIPCGKIAIKNISRLTANYDFMKNLCRSRQDPVTHYRKNLLLQDIWQLICYEKESAVQLIQRKRDPLMEEALQWLETYAFEPIQMKTLSDRLGLTAVQFTRRFHSFSGMTPTEYVSSFRLDKARSLLKGTRLTIEEIAQQCGYDNGLYFSRIFYKKMNTRPSQYRRDHQI